jgi:hypothetical protein
VLDFPLFSVALFLSACLLFWLELLFARLVLPLFGGAASVWNTCALFYQLVLLGGYAYAHGSAQRLGRRRQVFLHVGLLILALAFLPIALSPHFRTLARAHPAAGILLTAAISIGVPLFVASAASPLLQSWFAASKDPRAKDPYFLYQASNLGSLFALLSYPILIEPRLTLRAQSLSWSAGWAALAAATGLCASATRSTVASRPSAAAERAPLTARLRWVLLAFVPSSLTLSVTAYLSTAISPIPLLWVIPLALYLLSFVATFARSPWPPHRWAIRVEPFVLLPLALLMMTEAVSPVWLILPFHLAALTIVALVCHGELARQRPPARGLTDFYLWLALGGALGGVFNALLAPLIFRTVAEYPAGLVLACLMLPAAHGDAKFSVDDFLWPTLLGLTTAAAPWAITRFTRLPPGLSLKPLLCLPVVVLFLFKDRPVRLGLGLLALFLAGIPYSAETGRLIAQERSFYGVHKVVVDPENAHHWLTNGSVVQGGQSLDAALAREPLAYYTRSGPLGSLFAAFGAARAREPVAVIGLGTGSMACYGAQSQDWTFYELDPAVARIASDPKNFTFLRDCPARVLLGDARLSLADAPDARYGWVIVDAFNSDAIPVHLLTREALRLYLAKLAPDGLLAFHITNHFLDLAPVLAAAARDSGSAILIGHDDEAAGPVEKFASDWIVMARSAQTLTPLRADPRWRESMGPARAAWTDDYSDVFGIVRWN